MCKTKICELNVKDPAISSRAFNFVTHWIEHSTDYLKISISFIHSVWINLSERYAINLDSQSRTAVAHWIEHPFDVGEV